MKDSELPVVTDPVFDAAYNQRLAQDRKEQEQLENEVSKAIASVEHIIGNECWGAWARAWSEWAMDWESKEDRCIECTQSTAEVCARALADFLVSGNNYICQNAYKALSACMLALEYATKVESSK